VTSSIIHCLNILYPRMGPPTTPEPQVPHHLNPALSCRVLIDSILNIFILNWKCCSIRESDTSYDCRSIRRHQLGFCCESYIAYIPLVLETANALDTLKLIRVTNHCSQLRSKPTTFSLTRTSEKSLFCCMSKTWSEYTVSLFWNDQETELHFMNLKPTHDLKIYLLRYTLWNGTSIGRVQNFTLFW